MVLDERSKIDLALLSYAKRLIQEIENADLWFEYFKFDSGTAIIDFRTDTELYCIQMNDSKFGWARIEGEIGLSTIPDSGYLLWNEFKIQFDDILKRPTKEV